jgi:HPt (histidine-containing phosphotransfer) domain-containing protein
MTARRRPPVPGDAAAPFATDAAADALRCDALAVARACVALREPLFDGGSAPVRIELPCGPLPWLWLDESRLCNVLEGALASMAKGMDRSGASIALWLEPPWGEAHLHVELYADDPGAGLSFDIALERLPPMPRASDASAGRALLIGCHPARCRIVGAQLAWLGLDSDTCGTGDAALAAFARTPYRVVWLDDVPDLERGTLAGTLRRLERRRGEGACLLVSMCEGDDATAHDDGVDAWLDWPVPFEAWRALCAGRPWPEPDDEAAACRLFFEESRRDTETMRAALAREDWVAVARHAHRIKGGTVVLGEEAICAQAERVEEAARRALPQAGEVIRLLAELESALRGR